MNQKENKNKSEIVIPSDLKISMADRFKRMAAFLIDWNLIFLPCVLAAFFITNYLGQGSYVSPLAFLGFFLLIMAAFTLVIFRDVVCFGRSLGKRIFGLYIYDKETRQKPKAKQRLLRNIFFFLYVVDGILLLITGETIGDRAATTVVFSRRSLAAHEEPAAAEPPQVPSVPNKKKTVRIVVLVILAAAVCLAAFIGMIQLLLSAQKDTPEYQLAYEYLVSSEAFAQLDADASEIRMNSYSSKTSLNPADGQKSKTVEIGFIVSFRSFTVVCHEENGVLQICEECTNFA